MDYSVQLMPQTRLRWKLIVEVKQKSTACMPKVMSPSGDTTFKVAGRGGGTCQ